MVVMYLVGTLGNTEHSVRNVVNTPCPPMLYNHTATIGRTWKHCVSGIRSVYWVDYYVLVRGATHGHRQTFR